MELRKEDLNAETIFFPNFSSVERKKMENEVGLTADSSKSLLSTLMCLSTWFLANVELSEKSQSEE